MWCVCSQLPAEKEGMPALTMPVWCACGVCLQAMAASGRSTTLCLVLLSARWSWTLSLVSSLTSQYCCPAAHNLSLHTVLVATTCIPYIHVTCNCA